MLEKALYALLSLPQDRKLFSNLNKIGQVFLIFYMSTKKRASLSEHKSYETKAVRTLIDCSNVFGTYKSNKNIVNCEQDVLSPWVTPKNHVEMLKVKDIKGGQQNNNEGACNILKRFKKPIRLLTKPSTSIAKTVASTPQNYTTPKGSI